MIFIFNYKENFNKGVMMIVLKTDEQIDKMHTAGKLLASVHRKLRDIIKPGVTTAQIDQWVDEYLEENGATAEQKGYQGYQYATCASVNDEICHGFPTDEKLQEGDLVNIDMVVNVDGWLADSAWTYKVGEISQEDQKLMDVTKEALYRGIEQVKVGNRLGDIGHAIQTYVESEGFSVVREFIGHGIGTVIHEDPQVLHYGKPGRGTRLEEGMTFTIEPMINAGTRDLYLDENGWTAKTVDGKKSCQFEHTIGIKSDGSVIILTDQEE